MEKKIQISLQTLKKHKSHSRTKSTHNRQWFFSPTHNQPEGSGDTLDTIQWIAIRKSGKSTKSMECKKV